MEHQTPLISTIVAGLVLAFVFAAIAQRLRMSLLVGYLAAGVAVGPFTPGFVANQHLANELSEIGVILLMFGVGLHFSLKDLLSVRAIAIPGAIVQIASATVFGIALAWLMGWSTGAGIVFGLALSVASTVVLLRALQERRLIESRRGRIAVGWLIVEDIAMVLTLVLLPATANLLKGQAVAMADLIALAAPIGLTLLKVVAFVVFMLVVGRRVIPWLLHDVAHTGSRELFRLAVLALALGVAYAAAVLFGVSFALGAFFAGMILSESELSHRAANESLPLRDAFAVLFFVSVGMLFDPTILVREPLAVLATVLIIILFKSVVAFAIVRLSGYPNATALTIAVSLAQIGEFSFILAGLGVSLGVMPEGARDLVLAGALLSIMLNPVLFVALDAIVTTEPGEQGATARPTGKALPARPVVLVGYGRVGRAVREALADPALALTVVDAEDEAIADLRAEGIATIVGNAADPEVLETLPLADAQCLLLAIPNAFEGGQIVGQARALRADLPIIARSHSDEETAHLIKQGATAVVTGEHAVAKAMVAEAKPLGARKHADAKPVSAPT